MISAPATFTRESRLNRMMIWVCGTLLGVLAADAVMGSYNAGISPLKPILFVMLAVAACIGLSMLNKPRFTPVALLVLLLPLVRIFDAVILARTDVSSIGQVGMDMITDQGLRAARWAAILAICLTTGSEIYEMLGLAKFPSIPGRFSGFNGHPNFPPVLLCEMLGVVFAFSSNFLINCVIMGVAFVGVALTYGRSGFVVLALMGGFYILMNARRNLGFLIVIAAIAIPLVGVGFAILQSQTEKGVVKDRNTSERLEAIYSFDLDKLKSPERVKDLSDAWEGVMAKPIFGHGTGVSGALWAPHNENI